LGLSEPSDRNPLLKVRLCVPQRTLAAAEAAVVAAAEAFLPREIKIEVRAFRPPPVLADHALVITELALDKQRHVNGVGCSTTAADAASIAIIETAERASLFQWQPTDVSTQSEASTRAPMLAAGREIGTPLFPDTWPFPRYHRELALRCVTGTDLVSRQPCLVPVALVASVPPPERLRDVTTNGVAAGTNVDEATTRALFEALERDAIMFHWRNKLPFTNGKACATEPGGWVERIATATGPTGVTATVVLLYEPSSRHYGLGSAVGEAALIRARAEARQLAFRSALWPRSRIKHPSRADDHYLLYDGTPRFQRLLQMFRPDQERPDQERNVASRQPLSLEDAIGAVAEAGRQVVRASLRVDERIAIIRVLVTDTYALEGAPATARTPSRAPIEAATYEPHPFG
jgi:ribosomal protein S12 methylthiotransferase accessory factor YcaO